MNILKDVNFFLLKKFKCDLFLCNLICLCFFKEIVYQTRQQCKLNGNNILIHPQTDVNSRYKFMLLKTLMHVEV